MDTKIKQEEEEEERPYPDVEVGHCRCPLLPKFLCDLYPCLQTAPGAWTWRPGKPLSEGTIRASLAASLFLGNKATPFPTGKTFFIFV